MAIYRGGKLVGAGGSIAPTIFTDGVTLEGDGSENNRLRVKEAGVGANQIAPNAVGRTQIAARAIGRTQIARGAVGSVQLDEDVVSLENLANGTAGRTIVYGADGAPAEGYRSNPYAVWWGLNQKTRLIPQRAFSIDYSNTAILRFKGTTPDEHDFGGDALGNIMQAAPGSESFIETNVDTDYPDGSNESLTLYANQFFQLPAGVWRLHCHAETTGQAAGAGHMELMQVSMGTDDRKMAHTPGWHTSSNVTNFDGTSYDLIVPNFRTVGTEVFYLRLRKVSSRSENYSYFLMLEKLQ